MLYIKIIAINACTSFSYYYKQNIKTTNYSIINFCRFKVMLESIIGINLSNNSNIGLEVFSGIYNVLRFS